MRALLAPSTRQDVRTGSSEHLGRQYESGSKPAASREDAVGDCPVRSMDSLQPMPAGTWVCDLKLRVHHTESWPAQVRHQ